MRTVLRDSDIDVAPLRSKVIGILGYGNQGRVHALNLRDNDFRVLIGLRETSPSLDVARVDGFNVVRLPEAAERADFLVFALPDLHHGEVYAGIQPKLTPEKTLCFLHGFSIHYGLVDPEPDVDTVMVAPKGVAAEFRKRFLEGGGIPAVVAVAQDATGNALSLALAYGKAIGCARQGLYLSSFQEETEADLFTEQALLCGGVPFLLQEVFNTLVKAGFKEEIAYFETVNELKLIVDLISEKGLAGMFSAISPTAHFGAVHASKMLARSGLHQVIESLLDEIQSGAFARNLLQNKSRLPELLHSEVQSIAMSPVHTVFTRIKSTQADRGQSE